MGFGTFLLLQSPSARSDQEIFERGVKIAQKADGLGFESIWCAEHHFSTYGYLSRPLMFATHLATQTEQIRVGSAVIVLPLHHPLIVAEEIATADLLSGGRLDVGLGRGYQTYEFERLGCSLDGSRARFEEAVDILLGAFKGDPFSYQGQHYSFEETKVFLHQCRSRIRRSGLSVRAKCRSPLLLSAASTWCPVVSGCRLSASAHFEKVSTRWSPRLSRRARSESARNVQSM